MILTTEKSCSVSMPSCKNTHAQKIHTGNREKHEFLFLYKEISINYEVGSNDQKVGQYVTLSHVNGEWVLGKVTGNILVNSCQAWARKPKTPIEKLKLNRDPKSQPNIPVPSSQKSNQNSDLFEFLQIFPEKKLSNRQRRRSHRYVECKIYPELIFVPF